jgi:hypothetical protein
MAAWQAASEIVVVVRPGAYRPEGSSGKIVWAVIGPPA